MPRPYIWNPRKNTIPPLESRLPSYRTQLASSWKLTQIPIFTWALTLQIWSDFDSIDGMGWDVRLYLTRGREWMCRFQRKQRMYVTSILFRLFEHPQTFCHSRMYKMRNEDTIDRKDMRLSPSFLRHAWNGYAASRYSNWERSDSAHWPIDLSRSLSLPRDRWESLVWIFTAHSIALCGTESIP